MGEVLMAEIKSTLTRGWGKLWEPLDAAQGVGRWQDFSFSRRNLQYFSSWKLYQPFLSPICLVARRTGQQDQYIKAQKSWVRLQSKTKRARKKHNQLSRWFFFSQLKAQKSGIWNEAASPLSRCSLQIFSALFLKAWGYFVLLMREMWIGFFAVGFHWNREGKVGLVRMQCTKNIPQAVENPKRNVWFLIHWMRTSCL